MHGTPRYAFLCAFLCVRSLLSLLHSRLLALFAGAWGPRRAWPSRRRRGCCARPAGRREAYAGAIAHDAPAGPRARPSVRARRPPPRSPPSPPPVPRSPTQRELASSARRPAVSSATRARWAYDGRRRRSLEGGAIASSVLLPAFGGASTYAVLFVFCLLCIFLCLVGVGDSYPPLLFQVIPLLSGQRLRLQVITDDFRS